MKVTELKTMIVEAERPHIGRKYFLFLELLTDEGITGTDTLSSRETAVGESARRTCRSVGIAQICRV